jgi:hypothetical protein
MSIALPVRKRRPAPKNGWVCRAKERPMSALPAVLEFVTASVSILLGASERHTSDFPVESSLSSRLKGEVERMQR